MRAVDAWIGDLDMPPFDQRRRHRLRRMIRELRVLPRRLLGSGARRAGRPVVT
ncbi:MAG: hypothetical protein ACR2KP_06715 [Egibacteraceae bacterium]